MKYQILSGTTAIWITLIILKALNYLNWNWLIILLFPVWIPFLLAAGVIIVTIVLAIIAFLLLCVLASIIEER